MSLLYRIERYLKQADLPPTKFGRLAVNDPRLIGDLRNGRQMRPETAARVERFLAEGGGR